MCVFNAPAGLLRLLVKQSAIRHTAVRCFGMFQNFCAVFAGDHVACAGVLMPLVDCLWMHCTCHTALLRKTLIAGMAVRPICASACICFDICHDMLRSWQRLAILIKFTL